MPCGSGHKGRNAYAHIKSRQHMTRRLKSFQEVVSRQPGAPYKVQHVPDTGQIVVTPLDKGGDGACPTAPSMWDTTVAAV